MLAWGGQSCVLRAQEGYYREEVRVELVWVWLHLVRSTLRQRPRRLQTHTHTHIHSRLRLRILFTQVKMAAESARVAAQPAPQ